MERSRQHPLVAVALAATFLASLGGYARPPVVQAADSPFTDIAGTTFEADIEWLWAEGITVGCSPTAYCPDAPVTRGQMASFLVRMFDLADGWDIDAFSDDDGTTHEQDINRLAQAGITQGCSPTAFCPTAPVRRDEMASFLARAIPLTVGAGRNYFYDDNGTTHELNIDRAAAAGIASGCGTWRYCPTRSVTRGQMAGFLHRTVKPVTPPPYPAPDVRTLHVAVDGADEANDCLDPAHPCDTIGHSITFATDGDTISVGPGTFLEGDLVIERDITIIGSADGTTVDAAGPVQRRVFLVWGEVTFDRLTITGGKAALVGAASNDGGGIWSQGRLTITRSAIVGNSANARGGGIASAGFLEIADSVITGNEAKVHHGGGIFNGSRLTVVDSTICGNRAGWGGGGIASAVGISSYPTKSLDVRSTLVCDNEAKVGGGIAVGAGTATIANTTIVGNHATWTFEPAGGGVQSSGGSLDLRNVTVTGNAAPAGGGIAVPVPVATSLANVLVLANTGGNLAGTPPGSRLASIVGVPAGLTLADILHPAGLADNGGPTQTIALTDSAKNPAIGKGDAATCAADPVNGVDQRGEPRTPPCDIGAYELQK